ncbi:hypothetical protein LUZ63_019459 [Rhynchospora breviuscula]|uniref:non-specific serine/threonine protein kinase n=1 Tax=Rhynchospora breviuscula TaxID=2022672 RepID=A0A9Q0C677_9POAL|nr:hypothetical protein LUZ63_019457 [Rhynchospora breviuscula]KAJ1688069.1 hypothetical protein LUZ63_019459 [Rhynchospora breviuscula]
MSIALRFFTALAVVLLLSFSAGAVGSAGTLAISFGTSTVCGISASTLPRTIFCMNMSESGSTSLYMPYPNASFNSLSAGTAFLCGLESSRRVFFCWSGNPVNGKRIYRGPSVLSDLVVGETQVCAVDRSGSEIRWWRKAGLFPSSVLGSFNSLTSGNNFTCAITANGTVYCWGPLGSAMQSSFSNHSMTNILAGSLHMCGLDSSGFVICQGSNTSGQSYAPPGLPYEFHRFALGVSHTCAIRQPNGTAVCWGGSKGAHLYTPLDDTAFEFLVAGGNLTCGLTTNNYSVLCWGSDRRNLSIQALPFLRILPGICVVGDSNECNCGTYPDSESLCAGTGVICQRCDYINSLAPTFPPLPSESKRISKRWKVEAIVGSLCFCFGACGIAYGMWIVFYKKNEQNHHQIMPAVAPAGESNADATIASCSESDGHEDGLHQPRPSPENSQVISFGRTRRIDMPRTLQLQHQRSVLSTFNY